MDELSSLRSHAHKMDRALRRAVVSLFRPPAAAPCVLHRPLVQLRQSLHGLDVIIELSGALAAEDAGSWQRWLRLVGGRLRHHLPEIGGLAARIPFNVLKALLEHEEVRRISLDYRVRALLDVASPSVLADRVWQSGRTGKGVTLAVLDTGIHPHPDLTQPRNRIRAFVDLVNGRAKPYDDNGHGTHCAGDAAGNGQASGGRYRGPAWEADLVGVKVLDKEGNGAASTVMAGLQWCIKHKDEHGIRVVSLSLGAPAEQSYRADPLCRMLKRASEAGLLCCVAAGNSGPDSGSILSPGIDPLAVTVGAMDDRRTVGRADDGIAGFSSRGPTVDGLNKPDVVAPGVNVVSLRVPNSYLAKTRKTRSAAGAGDYYSSLSGTSMATPIVAGVAALVLEANPDLAPADVKRILMETAEDRGYPADVQGAGYVDAAAAARAAMHRAAASGNDAPFGGDETPVTE